MTDTPRRMGTERTIRRIKNPSIDQKSVLILAAGVRQWTRRGRQGQASSASNLSWSAHDSLNEVAIFSPTSRSIKFSTREQTDVKGNARMAV
jgi:hypothetical protein